MSPARLKILLLNDYSTASGGAEIAILALRDRLRAHGHDVRLFASRAAVGQLPRAADEECYGTTSRLRTLLQLANLSAVRQLRRTLARFRPDVVHVSMHLTQLSPAIMPLLAGVPAIYHAHWYREICPSGTKLLPDNTVCRARAGRPCLVEGCLPLHWRLPLTAQLAVWRAWRGVFRLTIANSESVRQQLIANDISPVTVIHYGVPVEPARPPLSSPPTAAFAGRLVREKGCDVLLRAFAHVHAQMPEARLVVVGDGPERAALGALRDRLGLSGVVDMAGFVAHGELPRALASAWVQVVPSIYEEPFGLVAAEAMMRGTAVIASGHGGLAEIVRGGETGWLVPPNDVPALAVELQRVLRDRGLAERVGASARESALRDLDEDRAMERYVMVYREAIEKAAHDAASVLIGHRSHT